MSALNAINPDRYPLDTAQRARMASARDAVAELIAADLELDAAADELAEAKRAKGNWRVNPLGHNHPAVLRMRAAKVRRAAALANVQGIAA